MQGASWKPPWLTLPSWFQLPCVWKDVAPGHASPSHPVPQPIHIFPAEAAVWMLQRRDTAFEAPAWNASLKSVSMAAPAMAVS